MNPTNTLLVIVSGMGQPLYAARGLTQTLKPIDAAGNITRSINGDAMNLSYEQFRKYASEISCTDVETPCIDGVWPGQTVVIDCVCELSFVTASGPAQRTVVTGSARIEGAFTFYRPRLTMMLVSIDIANDEYQADYAWKLGFVEV